MKNLIKAYKALSDESRLRVLNLLFERECCVCEVEQVLVISQSKASRILTTLYDAGFLTFRKEGSRSLYSVDWEGMEQYMKDILKSTKDGFAGNSLLDADRERLKTTERVVAVCVAGSCQQTTNLEKIKAS